MGQGYIGEVKKVFLASLTKRNNDLWKEPVIKYSEEHLRGEHLKIITQAILKVRFNILLVLGFQIQFFYDMAPVFA